MCDSIAYERREVFTRGGGHIIYYIYNIYFIIFVFFIRVYKQFIYTNIWYNTRKKREYTLYTSICAEIVQRTHFYNSSFFFFFFFFFFTFFFLLLFVFFFFFFFFFFRRFCFFISSEDFNLSGLYFI